ncbi:hypothetical protein CPAR01_14757 [Colletotrichum paranaense]|uniref:Uncharacterized protein n=2 Tax=Colletotrichum acutatum species complex TaxID=2707335 RepID=A0AAI9XIQ8_9PEZI|nr:uncharacterized protein CPAR01_14757 [Colletotrichum paranaense]KAK1451612.1 hypothetical protein CMEL01_06186 [Colletotrichum melonis]KAK1521840.1 hypothetical protein CPAR01_14757 [Colletotrichum paranaense]
MSFGSSFSKFLLARLSPPQLGRRVWHSSTSKQSRNFEHAHLAVIITPGSLIQGNLAVPKF